MTTPTGFNSKAQGRRLGGAPWENVTNTNETPTGFNTFQSIMPQSLVQIYVHLVFSTKHRKPFLRDPALRERTHAYLVGICKNQGSPALRVGGVEDHVHILCRLSKSSEVSALIRELKRDSSKWIKTQDPQLAEFQWQEGYGAFSVSPAHVEALIEYITNQEQHHRHESYQDEFRRLCKKYGIEIDERYVWD